MSGVPNHKCVAVGILSNSKYIGWGLMDSAHSNNPAEITYIGALVVPSSSLSSELFHLFRAVVLLTFLFLVKWSDSETFS